MSSIEGVDYLVDRYAILGVPQQATAEEITAAFRDKIKRWHPDRLHGLAPELVAAAEHQTTLLNEAYEVLGDVQKRTAFDEKLKAWDKPISTNGNVIIDLSSGSFSLGSLLGALSEDPAAREEEARTTALQFSNFDETTYELVCEQIRSSPDPSPALKKAYQAQVAARDLYLTLYEDMLRSGLGVSSNPERESRLHYREQVETELEETRAKASAGLKDQVLLLATGSQSLLPAPDGSLEPVAASNMLAVYEARIGEHFESLSARLCEVAAERETLLKERWFKGAGVEYHPASTVYTDRLIVRFKKDGVVKGSAAFIVDGTKLVGDSSVDLSVLDAIGGAEQLIGQGFSIVSYTPVADVEWRSQLLHVAEMHVERMKTDASVETVAAP